MVQPNCAAGTRKTRPLPRNGFRSLCTRPCCASRIELRLSIGSTYSQQFYFKDERGVGRNRAGITIRAVRLLGWNGEARFIANFQRGDSLVPTANDLSRAEHKSERVITIHGAVELRAV